jgi:PTH1 family peptidyl-tRNA hydrolase
LVVAFGLGNPGKRYDLTRHNIGKEVVAGLLRSLALSARPGRGDFLYGSDPDRDLHLVVPTGYVNSSGFSAADALDFFGATPDQLLVVFDDFSLPLGQIRIRKKGSDGGHNGLASIIYHLSSQDFPRVRLGIGPLPTDTDAADFVLSGFSAGEQQKARMMKEEAAQAVLTVAASGLDSAMNIFNKRAGD